MLESRDMPGASFNPASGLGALPTSLLADIAPAHTSTSQHHSADSSSADQADDPSSGSSADDLSLLNVLASAAAALEVKSRQGTNDPAVTDAFLSNPQLLEGLQPWGNGLDDALLPQAASTAHHPPLLTSPAPTKTPPGQGATGGSVVLSGTHGGNINAGAPHGSVSPSSTSSPNQTPLNQAAMMETASAQGGGVHIASAPSGNLSAGTQTPAQATEGKTFSGVVATFQDADGNTNPSKYTANINYGNGTQGNGTVSYANGVFSVSGSGTPYTEEGTYNITVTVTDSDGDSIQINNTAQVADATLTGSSSGSLSGTAGLTTSGALGGFFDGNPNSTTADYTVSINWGDNTTPTGGTVNGSNGSYTVSGSHVYAQPGTFNIVATITDDGGKSVQLTDTAHVSLPAPPVASNDSYSLDHDSTLGTSAGSGVLANDSGVGDTAAVVTGPQHGTLTLNANGSFLYTPTAHYTGSDSFT